MLTELPLGELLISLLIFGEKFERETQNAQQFVECACIWKFWYRKIKCATSAHDPSCLNLHKPSAFESFDRSLWKTENTRCFLWLDRLALSAATPPKLTNSKQDLDFFVLFWFTQTSYLREELGGIQPQTYVWRRDDTPCSQVSIALSHARLCVFTSTRESSCAHQVPWRWLRPPKLTSVANSCRMRYWYPHPSKRKPQVHVETTTTRVTLRSGVHVFARHWQCPR